MLCLPERIRLRGLGVRRARRTRLRVDLEMQWNASSLDQMGSDPCREQRNNIDRIDRGQATTALPPRGTPPIGARG